MIRNSIFRKVTLTDQRIAKDGDEPTKEGNFGFVLIDDTFVPFGLIDRIRENLIGIPTDYRGIIPIELFLDRDFLETFNYHERKLVAPCLLFLMEQGYIFLRSARKAGGSMLVENDNCGRW